MPVRNLFQTHQAMVDSTDYLLKLSVLYDYSDGNVDR